MRKGFGHLTILGLGITQFPCLEFPLRRGLSQLTEHFFSHGNFDSRINLTPWLSWTWFRTLPVIVKPVIHFEYDSLVHDQSSGHPAQSASMEIRILILLFLRQNAFDVAITLLDLTGLWIQSGMGNDITQTRFLCLIIISLVWASNSVDILTNMLLFLIKACSLPRCPLQQRSLL